MSRANVGNVPMPVAPAAARSGMANGDFQDIATSVRTADIRAHSRRCMDGRIGTL